MKFLQKSAVTVVAVVSVLSVNSCGTQSSGTQSDGATNPPKVITELEGTWKASCTTLSAGSLYYRYAVSVSGLTMVRTLGFYSNDTCTTIQWERVTNYTFTTGAEIAVDSGTQKAKKIDYTQNSIVLTPRLSSVVDEFNGGANCTYHDWMIGVGKDISGKTCSTPNGTYQANGAITYDLYQLNTTVTPNTLSFGNTPGSSEGSRPTNISTSDPFVKQ